MDITKLIITAAICIICYAGTPGILEKLASQRKLDIVPLSQSNKTLITGIAAAVLLMLQWKMGLEAFVVMALALYACLLASLFDIQYRKIPNDIVVAVAILGVVYCVVEENPFWSPLAGFAIAAVIFLLPSLFGMGCGAGDVKFIMALGILAGFPDIMYTILLMGLITAVYAFTKYCGVQGMKLAAANKTKIPMSPYITAGYVALLLMRVTGLISF